MVKSDQPQHYHPETYPSASIGLQYSSSHADNGYRQQCNGAAGGAEDYRRGGGGGEENRYASSSSASSVASSGQLPQLLDWDSASSTLPTSGLSSRNGDFGDVLKSSGDDLITTANLTPITDPLHTSTTSSSEEYYDDNSERIKLLCGDDDDDDDDQGDVDLNQNRYLRKQQDPYHRYSRRSSDKVGAAGHNRRRRICSRIEKAIHKARKKLNWQLGLLLTVIFIVFLSMSQLNDYQYRSVGIVGWNLNTTRDTAVYIAPDRHTATLEPRVIDRGKKYLLLVIVCSAVENFTTRQTIRQTWANGSVFNYENYFHRMHSHVAPGAYEPANLKVVQRVRRQLQLDEEGEDSERNDSDDDSTTGGAGRKDLIEALASQVIFLVGQPQSNGTQQLLVEESATHGDMLQENFLDTYNNLTLKSIMLLKWINHLNRDVRRVRVKYVMKCDDDTFLNLPNLVHVLLGGTVPIYKDTFSLFTGETLRRNRRLRTEMATQNDILMGYLFRNAKPIRDIASKWFAPKFMYRKKIYPNYLSGTGYLIEATSTAKELYKAALRIPIFHLEDVYITGLCATRGGARTKPHHNPLFSFLPYAKRECALRGMITQHPLTSSDIQRAYERLARNDSSHCELPSQESVENLFSSGSRGVVREGEVFILTVAAFVGLLRV